MYFDIKKPAPLLAIESWAWDHNTYVAYRDEGVNYAITVPDDVVLEFLILFGEYVDW